MNIAKILWEKAHWLTRIPGVYPLYLKLTNLFYPDGKVVTIHNGPLAGFQWRRFRCHQAWMAMGMYEPHVSKLIDEVLKPGDIFYDIGANAGYFTLVAARKVGNKGRVIAFEPVPFNVQVIGEQIELNHLNAVCQVEAKAVSSFDGQVSFVVPSRNANAHLADVLAPNVHNGGELIDVSAITLDNYFDQHFDIRPTLIKMDIEGAEVAALQGARELLSNSLAPIMLVSTHSQQLDTDVKNILASYGYKMYNLRGFEQMVYALPPRMSL